ncbi:MAG: hypothetical protein A2277_07835 [Desulfobacterales bacterium RIFOXYA12_FULL_46_15]|nr:MAG: hypothetical protein A2097_11635 [Desulfobacula sp. GWF2_41_7]OGR28571.1 MAG: hypothetical protein A2277_07835 [Desulfobacterales bacterium RIFOXYA12_FULL_46_15]
MKTIQDLEKLNDHILKIKELIIALEAMDPLFPALSRNSKRALASIKMLELNISDIITLDLEGS